MNIFEFLSFDLQEFITSTPGILIIIGILFLVLGVVMLMMEKKKGNITSEVTNTANEAPATTDVQQTATTETQTAPAETSTAPVETVAEAPVQTAEPINATPVVVPTEGDGVKEVPVAPVAETINFNQATPVDVPVVAPTEAPAVAPVAETLENKPEEITETLDNNTPVAPVVTESLDAQETTSVVQETAVAQPTVYGGVSPEVSKAEVLEEKPREIYGGANPLENTSPIPTATVNAAYNNAQVVPTVAPVTPTVETPAVAPVAPVVEAPTVAPVALAVETPTVAPVALAVETPAVAPAVEAQAVAPAVEAPMVAPVAPVAPVVEAPVPEVKKEEIERLEF